MLSRPAPRDLPCQVCELESAQLAARPRVSSEVVVEFTSVGSPSPPREPPSEAADLAPDLAPPLCLRLASSLLVAMSALAIGATYLNR